MLKARRITIPAPCHVRTGATDHRGVPFAFELPFIDFFHDYVVPNFPPGLKSARAANRIYGFLEGAEGLLHVDPSDYALLLEATEKIQNSYLLSQVIPFVDSIVEALEVTTLESVPAEASPSVEGAK